MEVILREHVDNLGSRGDIVQTTADGRVLLSQSRQVDVLTPLLAPRVAHTNPAPDARVALPFPTLSVTFDHDMIVGSATDTASVLNPANYQLTGTAAGIRGDLIRARGPYDLIFANILAGPLKRLAPQVGRSLAPGGYAVLSGLLDQQARGVEAVWRGHGMRAERRISLAGWTTLLMRRHG